MKVRQKAKPHQEEVMLGESFSQDSIAFDLLANRFTEFAVSFAAVDREIALASLDECANGVAVKLRSLRETLMAGGQAAAVNSHLRPAAEMLREALQHVRQEMARPRQ
jgi:hypothetical protein